MATFKLNSHRNSKPNAPMLCVLVMKWKLTLGPDLFRDLRFMCCFRFKLWWMTQRMGSCGRDIPSETQFLLVESEDSRVIVSNLGEAEEKENENEKEEEKRKMIYTVFLPLLEGSFRASLQGDADDHLQLCLESGEFGLF